MTRDTILIFAGAGASKAVDADSYPTTVDFFERLPSSISSNPLFTTVVEWLNHGDSTKTLDIELVLWALEELAQYAEQINDDNALLGWLLRSHRLDRALGLKHNYTDVLGAASRLRQVIRTLLDEVNREVYRFYSSQPTVAKVRSNWLALLDPLTREQDKAIELFTTNYDVIIEFVLNELANKDIGLREIKTGRYERGVHRILDLNTWSIDSRDSTHRGLLTKLHGSIDWSRGTDEIYISDPLFKGSHDRHVILYPGSKGSPDQRPFTDFDAYLQHVLAEAAQLVFIGFSFRDEHLNTVLRQATRPDAKIILLNPKDVDAPYQDFQQISGEFNSDSVSDLLKRLQS